MLTPLGFFAQQVVNALGLGSIYALTAIGLSLVYGLLGMINFAHGDILVVGAYLALFLLLWKVPFLWALLLATVLTALFGLVMERLAYRPLGVSAPEVAMLITSLGVSSLLENAGILFLTPQPRTFPSPQALVAPHNLGGVVYNYMALVVVVATAALLALLWLVVRRTKSGIALRAVAENRTAAQLMGMEVGAVAAITFALGSALAGVGGVLWAGLYGQVQPVAGLVLGLKAFVAAVIGGLGTIGGAVVGAFILGAAETFLVGYLPSSWSSYRDALVFVMLILVLLVRPRGVLGAGERRTA